VFEELLPYSTHSNYSPDFRHIGFSKQEISGKTFQTSKVGRGRPPTEL